MEIASPASRLIALGLLAVGLAGALLVIEAATLHPPSGPGVPYATTLQRTGEDAKERLLARGDGQFFAALATDPSMSRPEVLRVDQNTYAYRWIRPLYSWLGWVASLGRASAVPTTLIALTALSAGVLVGGAGMLAQALGREPTLSLGCLLLPGAVVILEWTGPELLAAGLSLAAGALIVRRRRTDAQSIVLLIGGVLARETILLMCAGLALWLWRSSVRSARPRAPLVLICPAVVFAGWFFVILWRTGASPLAAGGDRLSTPLAGLLQAVPQWSGTSIAMIGAMTVVVIAGVLQAGEFRGALVTIVAPTLLFSTLLGDDVWRRWEDISRVMLPVCAVLFVACLPRAAVTSPVPSD